MYFSRRLVRYVSGTLRQVHADLIDVVAPSLMLILIYHVGWKLLEICSKKAKMKVKCKVFEEAKFAGDFSFLLISIQYFLLYFAFIIRVAE